MSATGGVVCSLCRAAKSSEKAMQLLSSRSKTASERTATPHHVLSFCHITMASRPIGGSRYYSESRSPFLAMFGTVLSRSER